jgi:hypothetical protein
MRGYTLHFNNLQLMTRGSLTLLLRIRDILGSNLGADTGYAEFFFCGSPQSLQANAGMGPLISPRPLPSKS